MLLPEFICVKDQRSEINSLQIMQKIGFPIYQVYRDKSYLFLYPFISSNRLHHFLIFFFIIFLPAPWPENFLYPYIFLYLQIKRLVSLIFFFIFSLFFSLSLSSEIGQHIGSGSASQVASVLDNQRQNNNTLDQNIFSIYDQNIFGPKYLLAPE